MLQDTPVVENVPLAHGAHAASPASLNVSGAHWLQIVEFMSRNVPASHGRHPPLPSLR